jgi:uroporphyrinogen III methyltransferase/synthase
VTDRPLAGRSVLVTRTAEQAGALGDRLAELGAEVVAFPVIETVEPRSWLATDQAIERLGEYDWLVLTSTNGVDRFFERLFELDRDARSLAGVRVAAVGSATADRLFDRGIRPDLVPADFRAEGLIEAFDERGVGAAGERVLVARALEAREVLPETLRERGAVVDVVPVYQVVAAQADPAVVERLRAGDIDVITFASGGTAARFVEVVGAAGLDADAVLRGAALASVGPVTTEALRAMGHEVAVEPDESTMGALAEAIAAWAAGGGA